MKTDFEDQINILERKLHSTHTKGQEALYAQQQLEKDRQTLQHENQMYREKIDQLDKLNRHLEGNNTELTAKLSEQRSLSKIVKQELAEALRQNANLSILTNDLTGRLHKEALKAAGAITELKVLQEERESERILRKCNDDSMATLRQALEENQALSDRNIKLVIEKNQLQEQIKKLDRELINTRKLERLESLNKLEALFSANNSEHSRNCSHEEEIRELNCIIKRLEATVARKNAVLARLDEQIYRAKPRALPAIADQPLADQVVSLENTVFFLEKELNTRVHVITELREKYADLLKLEQQLKQAYQREGSRYQEMVAENARLAERVQEQQARLTKESTQQDSWKKKYEQERTVRQTRDRDTVILLIENEALQYMAQDSIGPEFKDRLQQLVDQIKAKKGPLEHIPQFKYSTIEQLLHQNRQLITELQHLRAKC